MATGRLSHVTREEIDRWVSIAPAPHGSTWTSTTTTVCVMPVKLEELKASLIASVRVSQIRTELPVLPTEIAGMILDHAFNDTYDVRPWEAVYDCLQGKASLGTLYRHAVQSRMDASIELFSEQCPACQFLRTGTLCADCTACLAYRPDRQPQEWPQYWSQHADFASLIVGDNPIDQHTQRDALHDHCDRQYFLDRARASLVDGLWEVVNTGTFFTPQEHGILRDFGIDCWVRSDPSASGNKDITALLVLGGIASLSSQLWLHGQPHDSSTVQQRDMFNRISYHLKLEPWPELVRGSGKTVTSPQVVTVQSVVWTD